MIHMFYLNKEIKVMVKVQVHRKESIQILKLNIYNTYTHKT